MAYANKRTTISYILISKALQSYEEIANLTNFNETFC